MERFNDANIFIRLIAWDDPAKGRACRALFDRVSSGRETLFTSEAVIAEVVFVLSSPRLYQLTRREVVARLVPLLQLRGLRLVGKAIVLAALQHYQESNLDFVDCLAVAHTRAEGLAAIYNYDKALDRIPGVLRQEP